MKSLSARVVAALLAATVFAGGTAIAQDPSTSSGQNYPSKPVRVVIPWPPGGGTTIAGRIVIQKVSESLGQQFIIDNRSGASGTIGADAAAKAPADGYTLMLHTVTHIGNAHLYKKLPYDTLRDFVGVAMVAGLPCALTVHPSLPATSVKQFIALAKARPNDIPYSSAGNGSIPHLQMALLASMTGIKLVHVPYKGGGPAVVALLSGETPASIPTIPSAISHIKARRLNALGVTSAQRSPALPEVPTIAEAGVPGYEMSPWIALFAPAGTPRPVIMKLNAEVTKALKLPEMVQALADVGLDLWASSPEELSARIKADYEKYGRIIKLTGATTSE
ncbi:MAG: tripartite tricarboxylate transporter substrate binding protein [Burkholderiales bacterium]